MPYFKQIIISTQIQEFLQYTFSDVVKLTYILNTIYCYYYVNIFLNLLTYIGILIMSNICCTR